MAALQALGIDPTQAIVFAVGLALAWMVVRLIKGAGTRRSGAGRTRRMPGFLPAAIALAVLAALWLYLRS